MVNIVESQILGHFSFVPIAVVFVKPQMLGEAIAICTDLKLFFYHFRAVPLGRFEPSLVVCRSALRDIHFEHKT